MKLLVILLLILFVLLSFNKHTPFWSQNYVSIPSGSQYSSGKNYGFQINWTDSDLGIGGVSKVLFESDFSGVLTNYSSGTNPAVLNNTKGIYWINFTDLKAGNYVFRWYANDTSDHFNFTDQWNYIINKNDSYSMKLLLDGTEGSKSYRIYDKANFTVSLKIPNKIVYLNSTYPNWILQSGTSVLYNETKLNSSGLFSITAYWDGDENYSSRSITYKFDNMPPQYVNNIAYPPSGNAYSPGASYTFNINWNDATLKEVFFKSNHTGVLRTYTPSSSSGIFSITLENLPAMNFTYEWIARDTLNLENTTGPISYIILKKNPLTLELSPSVTVYEGTKTTVKCFSSTEEVKVDKFKLYRNSELIENTSLFVREETKKLEVGTYIFVCNSTETQNFTKQNLSLTLTVKPNTTETLKITDTYFPALDAGKSTEASFVMLNNFSERLFDISVNLSGIPSNWYNIESFQIVLSSKTSQKVKIIFNTPSNAEAKTYSILIIVKGKTVSGDKIATEGVETIVYRPSPEPRENKPPEFSKQSVDNTITGKASVFSLKVTDDLELSGYIFSTNITGVWKNDSWINLYGTEDWVYTSKTLNLPPGSTIAWKVYANDSNSAWAVSEEFYLKVSGEEQIDYTLILIGVTIIAAVIIIIIFVRKVWIKKLEEEIVHYVYRKEDLK